MSQIPHSQVLAGLALAGLLAAAPAGADWLVSTNGERMETRGEWKVEGRRILYTSTRGTLSSIRLTEVDVEASRALTEEMKSGVAAPEVVPEPERAEPVLRLTDADFPAPEPSAPPPVEGAEGETEGEGGAALGSRPVPASDGLENRPAEQLAGDGAVQVLNWSVRPTGADELSIVGDLSNVSDEVATAVALTVTLLDADALVVDSTNAQLSANAIMPGGRASYVARFSDDLNFGAVEFTATSIGLEVAEEELADDELAEEDL
ncbi:MAG: FxLYD domain-containing protein [Thermoanaerobaculia bacterium]|nr:FxLYD domain-containing protein [Thermoanaerobaculia bacterium]